MTLNEQSVASYQPFSRLSGEGGAGGGRHPNTSCVGQQSTCRYERSRTVENSEAPQMECSSGRAYTLCGPTEYLPPEMVVGRAHGRPADLWALGCLVHLMLTGRTPFRGAGGVGGTGSLGAGGGGGELALLAAVAAQRTRAAVPPPPLPLEAMPAEATVRAATLSPHLPHA
eukprot:134614-Chlamydomonas_euryale.AAC.2